MRPGVHRYFASSFLIGLCVLGVLPGFFAEAQGEPAADPNNLSFTFLPIGNVVCTAVTPTGYVAAITDNTNGTATLYLVNNGKILWSKPLPAQVSIANDGNHPLAFAGDDHIIVADSNSDVILININGRTVWIDNDLEPKNAAGGVDSYGSMILVTFGISWNNLNAPDAMLLNSTNGSVSWTFTYQPYTDAPHGARGYPLFSDNGQFAFSIGNGWANGGTVFYFGNGGHSIWNYTYSGGYDPFSTAITPNGDYVIVQTMDLYDVNGGNTTLFSSSGHVIWSYVTGTVGDDSQFTGGNPLSVSPNGDYFAVATDGVGSQYNGVYLFNRDGLIYHAAIFPVSSTWSWPSVVAFNNGTVIAGLNNEIYELNPQGDVIGTASLPYNISDSIAITTNGQVVAIGTDGGLAIMPSSAVAPTAYSVTFVESGLLSGTNWSLTLGGQTKSSSSTSITFSEPNGVYSYSVGTVPGYSSSPSSGTVTVNGANIEEGITFTEIPPATYPVTFTESGLPPGTSWSVTLSGNTQSSNTSLITFKEPAGTYSYSVGSVSGYSASPSSGTLTVSGPLSEYVHFTELAPAFSVSASKSSLTVSVGGSANETISVSSIHAREQVTLSLLGLPAGSSYSFSPSSGITPFTSALTITVPSYTPAGTYNLEIIGSSQGVTERASVLLTVNNYPPTPSESYMLTLSVSPSGTDGQAYAEWGIFDRNTSPRATDSSQVQIPVQGGESLILVAKSPSGSWYFERWQTSGGISLANPRSSSTTATIKGNAYVTAIFAEFTPSPSAFAESSPPSALVANAKMVQETSKDSEYYNFTLYVQLSSNYAVFLNESEEVNLVNQIESSLNANGYNIAGARSAVFQAQYSQSASYMITVFNALFEGPELASDIAEGGVCMVTPLAIEEIMKHELLLSPPEIVLSFAKNMINGLDSLVIESAIGNESGLGDYLGGLNPSSYFANNLGTTTFTGVFTPFNASAFVGGDFTVDIVISNVLVPKGQAITGFSLNAQYLELPQEYNAINIASAFLSGQARQSTIESQTLYLNPNVQWSWTHWYTVIIDWLTRWL